MQVSAAAARGFGELLAAHPRAAAATLLIGSNDVLASLNSRARPMSGSTSEDLVLLDQCSSQLGMPSTCMAACMGVKIFWPPYSGPEQFMPT